MGMAINQARQQRLVFQVNHFSARWNCNIRADSGDAATFNQNERVVGHLACAHIQYATGLDSDDFRGRLLSQRDHRNQQDKEQSDAAGEFVNHLPFLIGVK